jgi:hypothetical protein
LIEVDRRDWKIIEEEDSKSIVISTKMIGTICDIKSSPLSLLLLTILLIHQWLEKKYLQVTREIYTFNQTTANIFNNFLIQEVLKEVIF